MKRTLTYISGVLLLITALCISCQKEQNSLEEKGAPANEVVIRATISDAATKVSFKEDDNKLKTAWETDDHIVGWDADGHAIELEIASIEDNIAIFKTVEGSAAIPTSGKVYMIYAPGKTYEDVSSSSLVYDLSDQGSGKLPALMTATGEVSNNVLALNFTNNLAIVAVKNPKFPVTAATPITGLQLSGSNIRTKATFSVDQNGALKMEPSMDGTITRACDFTTAANGTSETMVYFAVLPNSTAADVTVSTTAPEGYQISFPGKSFTAGMCYMLNQKDINKQTFTVTVANGITGGTITTNPSSGASVAWGETVTVTATPATGYELATLTYTDSSDHDILSAKSFTMPKANVTVSGTFQLKDFAITQNAATGGTYTVKKGSDDVTTAQMGDVITVTAAPATGYSGGTVTVKETDTDEDVTFDATNKTFTMPAADVTITVTFTQVPYSITSSVTPASSGNVTFKKSGSSTGITKAHYEEEITVEATPAAGYELVSIKWKEEGGSDTDITSTKMFTMPAKNVTVTVTFEALTGTINDHNYVKIGGKKWATMNIGASSATEAGRYFEWGDVTGLTWSGSAWSGDGGFWNPAPEIGNPTTLPLIHDAANKNWGSTWRMPTKDDFVALAANGVWYWTADYNSTGVSGCIVYVAKNDDDKGKANMKGTWKKWDGSSISTTGASAATGSYDVTDPHIFFPAAGAGWGSNLENEGVYGAYWSSTLYSGSTDYAYYFRLNNTGVFPQGYNLRHWGYSVRPLSD